MSLNTATLRQRVVEIVSATEQRLRSTSLAAFEIDPMMDPTKATIYNELSFRRLMQHVSQLSERWSATTDEVISQLHMLVGVFPVEEADESEAFAKLLDASSLMDDPHYRTAAPLLPSSGSVKAVPNAPVITLLEQRYRDLAREHHEQSSQLEFCEAKLRRREVVLQYVQNMFLHEVVMLSEQVAALTNGGVSGKNARASGVNMSVLRGNFSLLDWLEVLELLFDPRASHRKNKAVDPMVMLEDIRERRRRGDVTHLVDEKDAQATAAAAFNTFKQLHEYKEIQSALQEREELARDTIARLKNDFEQKQQALNQMSIRHNAEVTKLRNQVAELQNQNQFLTNDVEYAERRIAELEGAIRDKEHEVEETRVALEEQSAQHNLSHLTGLTQDSESKNAAAAEAAKLALERQRIYGLLDKILSGGAVSRADIMASLNEDDPATAGFLRGAEEMKTREADYSAMKEEVERLKEDLQELAVAKDAGDAAIEATIEYFHLQGLRIPRSIRHLYPDDADDGFDKLAEVDWCAEAKSLELQIDAMKKDANQLINTIASASDEFPAKLRIQTFDASLEDTQLESTLTTPRGDDALVRASLALSQTETEGGLSSSSPMIIQNAARRASINVPQTLVPPSLPRRASVATSHSSTTGTAPSTTPTTLASAFHAVSDIFGLLRMRIAYDAETAARSKTAHDRLSKQYSDARDQIRHMLEQLTTARSENQNLRNQASTTQTELGELRAELGDVMIELDNARKRCGELTQQLAAGDAKRAAMEVALVESAASRAATPPLTQHRLREVPKKDCETQTDTELAPPEPEPVEVAPPAELPVQLCDREAQTDPISMSAFPNSISFAVDDAPSTEPKKGDDSKANTVSRGRRKSMVGSRLDEPAAASPSPASSVTLPSSKQPTAKSSKKSTAPTPLPTSPSSEAKSREAQVKPKVDNPDVGGDDDGSSLDLNETPPLQTVTPALGETSAPKSNAIPKDVIDKLWAAIDAAGTKDTKPSATHGNRSSTDTAASQWKSSRTVCVSCGSSIAVASATSMNRRVIATMTASIATGNDHHGSSAGSHVRFTALPKGSHPGAATASAASQCDLDAEEGLLVAQDDDDVYDVDDSNVNNGSYNNVSGIGGPRLIPRSRRSPTNRKRSKNASMQTCGWSNLTPAQDYAVAISRPDETRLTLATLKHHRRVDAQQRRLDGLDVEGEVAPYDPRVDAHFEAILGAEEGDFVTLKHPPAQTLPQRQFSAAISTVVNRGKRLAVPPPPSSIAESSSLGDIAQALNALDHVTWEAEGPSLPGGARGPVQRHTSAATVTPTLSQLPIFRGGIPPMPKRVPSASRPASREAPITRAGTPDLVVRPSSVDTTIDRRTSLVRPPSGAAIAAAKQKLLLKQP